MSFLYTQKTALPGNKDVMKTAGHFYQLQSKVSMFSMSSIGRNGRNQQTDLLSGNSEKIYKQDLLLSMC